MGPKDGGFVDGEGMTEKENGKVNRPTEENAGSVGGVGSRRGLPKHINSTEKTANQIPHQEFSSFVEEYFGEIDEDRFKRMVWPTEIDEGWLSRVTGYERCYEGHQELMFRSLVGCLVDRESVSVPEGPGGMGGDLCTVESKAFCENRLEFFRENGVLEAFSNNHVEEVVELYRRQVEVNNKRKRTLEEKLRERLVYPACWGILRTIDTEIDNIFIRSKRHRRKKGEFDEEAVREVLEKREGFCNVFGDMFRLEEDYKDYEDLFDPGDDVDAKEYGIEPYSYFC